MRRGQSFICMLAITFLATVILAAPAPGAKVQMRHDGPVTVYILPIRWDIMPPLLSLVERGVKEANDAQADVLVIDMHTNGGRVDVTEDILKALDGFNGIKVTYVNEKAISAGALISLGTQRIFMAPSGRIGDAAPVMMSPGGSVQDVGGGTMEEKINSYVRALARTYAQKNGHNEKVVEAMINRDHEDVEIAGEMICPKGQLLTLTARDAEKQLGDPPVTLFSEGTKDTMDDVLTALGVYDAMQGRRRDLENVGLQPAMVVRVEPTSFEMAGFWFSTISPILMMVGIVGLFIEFKTPGFGVPGIVGLVAFAVFFLGGYVADLSGKEWVIGCFLVFLVGLVLVGLEFYVFPGTIMLGAVGGLAVLAALLFAQLDLSSRDWSMPAMPELSHSLLNLFIALVGSGAILWLMAKFLPQTGAYSHFASVSASGVATVEALKITQAGQMGMVGRVQTQLQPGGKAMFGDELLDVISQGELVEEGNRVRVIGHSGNVAIVEIDENA